MPLMKYFRSLLVVLVGLFLKGSLASKKTNEYVDGAEVDSPADLSKKGWKAALVRTGQALKDKNLSMMAAGLAYYTTLAFFPATLGLATLYASVAGPGRLLSLLKDLELVVPPAIQDLLQTQLSPLANADQSSLGIATLVSFALVLWTMSGGIQNLIKATNIAYEVEETRKFIKLRLLSLALSVAFILFGALILVLLLMQGDALQAIGLPSQISDLFPILRWPLLVVVISVVLSIVYRYAPNRRQPRWSWVSWGATAATIIWLLGTALFFFYVQHFGNFNKSYGTFASIIILMTWFNLSSLIVLVGAQVNKKLEEVTVSQT